MWEMYDDILTMECDECGLPMGPPPKFMIPPPPRPPTLADISLNNNCNEEEMALKAQQAWDSDICEAIPILDASLYSSQSLQTSAMIAVFTLLLVLVVLISSLFVWKNKRKMQNLLPCKTPTRGPHLNGGLQIGTSQTVTYEDPDAHLGHHRPLVMRHHHNVEMMHGKSIHYPSGYPMTRSPPFLVSSSPGPDPYRSNDNVYEELGPTRESDGESEPPLHSDDDFAEDELSLPGERSFNKTNVSESTATLPASSTFTSERPSGSGTASMTANIPERISVLSSSSSTQDASTATVISTNSSHNNNNGASGTSSGSGSRSGGIFSGVLRHTTGRNKTYARSRPERLNNATSTSDTAELAPVQQLYDNRSNLMTLGYMANPHTNHQPYHHSLHHINNGSNSTGACLAAGPQYFNNIESDVERRNRINAQLNQVPAVATIFRERIHYPGSGRYPQPYYASNSINGLLSSSMRARTNPRSADRRHRIAAPLDPLEPSYAYAEPVFQQQQNYHYDTCTAPALQQPRLPPYPAYIMPDYAGAGTSSTSRSGGTGGNFRADMAAPLQPPQQYQNPTQLYARGDSSFGSDSGYSHHTPASSIGRHDYETAMHLPQAAVGAATTAVSATATTPKTPSKLTAAFNFGWNRRKNVANEVSNSAASVLNVGHEVSSPNNNNCANAAVNLENPNSAAATAAAAGVAPSTSINNNVKT